MHKRWAQTWLTSVTRQEGNCAARAAVTPVWDLVRLARHSKAAMAALLSGLGTDCRKVFTNASEAFAEQFSKAAEPSMLTLNACKHL